MERQVRPVAVLVNGIAAGSPAEKAGLKPGDTLVSINGHEIRDGLDYGFYATSECLVLAVQAQDGSVREVTLKKGEYEELGCVFDSYLIDKQHSCKNKCVFCFVDQTPKGMRESLYFKDDDERLSFLFGNYVTLTNLSQREVDRIIEMRIQPVNISVHTMNPDLRVKMMKNPNAGKVLSFIPQLAAGDISMNCQLVLVSGMNDGAEMEHSVNELCRYYPQVESVAAVPVGLTKFRQGLADIEPYTPQTAKEQLELMLRLGDACVEKIGRRFIFPSDEWFLMCGLELPEEAFYEGYLQLENGVGMWRLFHDDFIYALEEEKPQRPCAIDVVTGTLAADLMQGLAQRLREMHPGCEMHVHVVQNDFFGHGITVTGLLTGTDLINQLKGCLKSDLLVIPSVCFRAEGDIMLDDVSVPMLEEALGVNVHINNDGAQGLVALALGKR